MNGVARAMLVGGVSALAAAACSGNSADTPAAAPVQERVIRVVTPYSPLEAAGVEASFAPFAAEHGVEIELLGRGGDLVDALLVDVVGEQPPHLAIIPQPSIVDELYRRGVVEAIPEDRRAAMAGSVRPILDELSRIDGVPVSVWARANVSVVWFRADIFQDQGWTAPTTLDGFIALVDEIASTSDLHPLCIGISAGGATGWYLTDYIELLLLNRYGPEVYDAWVANEVPFDDPRIVELMELVRRWVTDTEVVTGGADALLRLPVEEGFAQLADGDCLMNVNADWVVPTLAEEFAAGEIVVSDAVGDATTALDGPTIGAFAFPGATAETRGATVGGDQMVALRDEAIVWDLMEYVASPRWGEEWAEVGAFLSPSQTFDVERYADPAVLRVAEVLDQATVARFDGADLMPSAVGTGAFWSGMVDLTRGVPAVDVATEIESFWPAGDDPG